MTGEKKKSLASACKSLLQEDATNDMNFLLMFMLQHYDIQNTLFVFQQRFWLADGVYSETPKVRRIIYILRKRSPDLVSALQTVRNSDSKGYLHYRGFIARIYFIL